MSKQYLQTYAIRDAHSSDIFAIAITPDQLLSASGDSCLKIHLIAGKAVHADDSVEENPYPLRQLLKSVHPLGCHHLCTSLDGATAVSSGFGGEVLVWQCEDAAADEPGLWKEKLQLSTGHIKAGEHWALALNETGRFLACTTHDGRVNVYDIEAASDSADGRIVQYETKASFGMAVDISSDGEMTASGHQNGSIYIFNNTTQRLAHSLAGLVKAVRAVKFSPACRYLAAAGDAKLIALYDTKSGEQVASLSGHASWITSLDWNWSGEYLLSGGYDGKIKIWSVERRECVATQTESDDCIWAVKWLHKAAAIRNETFVAAGAGKTIAFYREASGT